MYSLVCRKPMLYSNGPRCGVWIFNHGIYIWCAIAPEVPKLHKTIPFTPSLKSNKYNTFLGEITWPEIEFELCVYTVYTSHPHTHTHCWYQYQFRGEDVCSLARKDAGQIKYWIRNLLSMARNYRTVRSTYCMCAPVLRAFRENRQSRAAIAKVVV